jgi:hypothetical protein
MRISFAMRVLLVTAVCGMLRPMRTPFLIAAALGALAVVPSAATAAPLRCHTADLSAKVGSVDAGAGQRNATLTLTNHSGHTCATAGYVGLQLTTATGAKIPTSTRRAGGSTPTVTLKPGAKAVATLAWTVIASGDEPTDGPCEKTPTDLLVIPPNETTQTATAWTQGPVCAHGRFTVGALKKG